MTHDELIAAIRERLSKAETILVVSHIRPDGDAVGSMIGLGLALEDAGKKVQMVLADGVPDALRFIPESDRISRKPNGIADLVVVVDAAEIHRVGDTLTGYGIPDLNIDHHVSNTQFAHLNLVESDASATAEILTERLPELGLRVTPTGAKALLTGLLTDTIGFRIPSVQPKTLRLAADLVEMGAQISDLYSKALLQKSVSAVRYWGAGLSNLQVEDGLVWTTLTLADRSKSAYPERDDADLINVLSGIRGAAIAVIFVEQAPDRVKVSWRAQAGHDVSSVAARFGGGGHRAASGADVKGTLPEVQERVLSDTRHLLKPSNQGEGT